MLPDVIPVVPESQEPTGTVPSLFSTEFSFTIRYLGVETQVHEHNIRGFAYCLTSPEHRKASQPDGRDPLDLRAHRSLAVPDGGLLLN